MSVSGLSKKSPTSGRLPPKISGQGVKPTAITAQKPTKLPDVLAYPKFHSLDVVEPVIKDHLIYVIRHYGRDGIAVLILRDPNNDRITVLCGDWNGNNIDLDGDNANHITQAALVFVQEDLPLFMKTMHAINLRQAQFFLAIDDEGRLTLTDIQIAFNKLAGPGMVRDIFGKIYRTQEVLKIEPADERALEFIRKGTGTYEGDLVIKPSKFTTFGPTVEDSIIPLYAEVRR